MTDPDLIDADLANALEEERVGGEIAEHARSARMVIVGNMLRRTHVLNQTLMWIDREGNRVPLEHIDERYAYNIVRFLLRRARNLKYAEEEAMAFDPLAENLGDAASDAFDNALDELMSQTPTQWLAEKPLVRALWMKVHPEKREALLAIQPEPDLEDQMGAAGFGYEDLYGD